MMGGLAPPCVVPRPARRASCESLLERQKLRSHPRPPALASAFYQDFQMILHTLVWEDDVGELQDQIYQVVFVEWSGRTKKEHLFYSKTFETHIKGRPVLEGLEKPTSWIPRSSPPKKTTKDKNSTLAPQHWMWTAIVCCHLFCFHYFFLVRATNLGPCYDQWTAIILRTGGLNSTGGLTKPSTFSQKGRWDHIFRPLLLPEKILAVWHVGRSEKGRCHHFCKFST